MRGENKEHSEKGKVSAVNILDGREGDTTERRILKRKVEKYEVGEAR